MNAQDLRDKSVDELDEELLRCQDSVATAELRLDNYRKAESNAD